MPDDTHRFTGPIDPCAGRSSSSGSGLAWLRRDGVHLRAPGDVGHDQIRGCLWELIYALAARRIFLSNTNHLSDAELYAWLHDKWLPRCHEHLSLESRGNHQVDLLGSGSDADNDAWLRFYADEVLREIWSRDFPEDAVPPCEAAPFDRDRWLPQPPQPHQPAEPDPAPDGDGGGTSFDELDDPLHLEAVDREINHGKAGFETEEVDSDGHDIFGGAELVDSTEGLLREPAVGIETGHWRNPHFELTAAGVVLPPPEELTDEALPAKLWEVLHELACRGFYLLHTDHLGDRELYTKLWREDLREPAILPGTIPGGGWYHDFIGSGGAEAVRHWLRYYANDLEREKHAREYPDQTLPPRENCPYCRDHRLPQGPF
ncbi:MAG TPA: hypothetical protein VJS65_03415 [Verrucomicrobiae bacterium]|nr:hypothetical protein [Verrucomicrobiae bacterium]